VVHLLNVFNRRQVVLRQSPITKEFAMNIELDEVIVLDVSDDALELAAVLVQGGYTTSTLVAGWDCC
jgi:hypothetical protein